MVYRDKQIQHTIQFVYVSDGNCLNSWEDDDSGALIDILAIGTGEDASLELIERILEAHEVHTIILPESKCKSQRAQRFKDMGVAEILWGNGTLLRGAWRFIYWSYNGTLNIYHENISDGEPAEIMMGKMIYENACGCSPYLYHQDDCCDADCFVWNDCEALNTVAIGEDDPCTGTLILGKRACDVGERLLDFIRGRKRQLRAVLLTMDGKELSRMSEILKIRNNPQYCYYLGGNGDAGLAAEITLSSPYAHYQSLKRGYGACIGGCFLKEDSEKDC